MLRYLELRKGVPFATTINTTIRTLGSPDALRMTHEVRDK